MPLTRGRKLGPYEILGAIGAGGMGEVYKARDTRLDRTVALKVLPAARDDDQKRRQRFEREARTISSLSHPHICALFDIGDEDGVPFLVMEHLEGETLADRLLQGPLPLEQALRHAVEIASALDQAHRHGVIHRDLKPANVMLTRHGVKLLDFGLAKVLDPSTSAASFSPPVSQTLTAQGTIVGTLPYMAPEQLEGTEADARSDMFAFGAVLYEMISGQRPFQASSHAGLISAIIGAEPHGLSMLQPTVPAALDHVVKTCLAKDPQARWQNAHDVSVQLKWIAESASQPGGPQAPVARRRYRERVVVLAAALLVVALASLAWMHVTETRPTARPTTRFAIPQPEHLRYLPEWPPVVSPDGRTVAVSGLNARGRRAIWLRRMESLDAEPLAGTEGATGAVFWSPDSRYLVFSAAGKILRIEASGGPAVALANAAPFWGGAWNQAGLIVLGSFHGAPGIRRLSATGGEVDVVLSPDQTRQETNLYWPSFLPDGRHFLYYARTADLSTSSIRIGSLDSVETRPLVAGTGPAFYVPEGYVLFTRQNTAFALPFDARTLRATGDAIPVIDGVGSLAATGTTLTVSQTGVLAYRDASALDAQLAWYERSGRRLGAVSTPGPYRQAALSPDSRKVVLERLDPNTNTLDLWWLDLTSGIMSRLTADPADETDPVWSPDSRHIAFASLRGGRVGIYRKAIGTSQEELVFADEHRKVPEWWLEDGTILFMTNAGGEYYQVPAEGERKPKRVFQTDFITDEPCLSPGGRWIAFNSNESGRSEVYVATFPGFTEKRQVSTNGGSQARWRADGKELYYLTLSGEIMAVEVRTGSSLEPSMPRQLVGMRARAGTHPLWDQYGATADGQRFLAVESADETPTPITVMLDWPALLSSRR